MHAALAMLVDSYRQLNAKKLFWVTLGISAVVVLFYASIGFDENGMSMLFGLTSMESEVVREGSPVARMLYRGIFSTFIVGFWLSWIAIVLALVSTTTVFPDFIASGSIELVLSKPISRLRLFVFKYLASLLFVLLQVGLFCAAVFVCLGWRIHEWNWTIFAAIPLVTLMYSYIYSVNVLVGVWTRSALAALLASLLFWFLVFSVTFGDHLINQFHTQFTIQVEEADEEIASLESRRDAARQRNPDGDLSFLDEQIRLMRQERNELDAARENLDGWRRFSVGHQAMLPKTSQTVALLDRWLKEESDINMLDILRGNVMLDGSSAVPKQTGLGREVELRMLEEEESQSVAYVVGTSIAFELVVLGLACFVFVRRDY